MYFTFFDLKNYGKAHQRSAVLSVSPFSNCVVPHLPSPVLTMDAYPHSHGWSSALSVPLRQEAMLPPLLLSDPEASEGLVTSWPRSFVYSVSSWRCSQVYGGLRCVCAPVSRPLIFLLVPGSDIIWPIPETQLLLAFNMPQISLTWSFNE